MPLVHQPGNSHRYGGGGGVGAGGGAGHHHFARRPGSIPAIAFPARPAPTEGGPSSTQEQQAEEVAAQVAWHNVEVATPFQQQAFASVRCVLCLGNCSVCQKVWVEEKNGGAGKEGRREGSGGMRTATAWNVWCHQHGPERSPSDAARYHGVFHRRALSSLPSHLYDKVGFFFCYVCGVWGVRGKGGGGAKGWG